MKTLLYSLPLVNTLRHEPDFFFFFHSVFARLPSLSCPGVKKTGGGVQLLISIRQVNNLLLRCCYVPTEPSIKWDLVSHVAYEKMYIYPRVLGGK